MFQKSSRTFLEFPGIFKHSFFKYFRYFLDNHKQRYIREPQGIPIWTPFGGRGAPQGPPKSTPGPFEWLFLAHLTVNTIQMMIFGAKIAILAPILEVRGLSNRHQNTNNGVGKAPRFFILIFHGSGTVFERFYHCFFLIFLASLENADFAKNLVSL